MAGVAAGVAAGMVVYRLGRRAGIVGIIEEFELQSLSRYKEPS